jgi:pyridoxal phosphate enzyme (YggS family)|tara:strand:- start:1183 stop:1824 length:642 start_codon:yes stop_codon:yes gene_type:complete
VINLDALREIQGSIPDSVKLVAVSKTKPVEDILEAYKLGIRDFGENRVQELVEKSAALPSDIKWHAIGHIQRNKAKLVTPISHLIHAVDSKRLFDSIAKNIEQTTDVLIQIHIAEEDSKHGFTIQELHEAINSELLIHPHVRIRGLMGMATFTDDYSRVANEFRGLRELFDELRPTMGEDFDVLSMGMSGDWKIAVDEGSTLIRVGSAIFGSR